MKELTLALALLAVATAQNSVTPRKVDSKKGLLSLTHQQNRLSNISMIMLGVESMRRSVEFYRDLLGLELQSQVEEFAFFKTGPVTLVLNAGLGKQIQPRAGAVEIIFPVDSVTSAHDLLFEKGVRFRHKPRAVNSNSFAATFQDPDGHLLTLFGGL
jgi:catechol 2,3-dioxygenase-like lactoylglutathione lyase family enzyme